ncbi:hypothetical protein RB597_004094 [Gaeumannomyces tritici]
MLSLANGGGFPADTGDPLTEPAHPSHYADLNDFQKEIAKGFVWSPRGAALPPQMSRRAQAPSLVPRTLVDHSADMAKRFQGTYPGASPKASTPLKPSLHIPMPEQPSAPNANIKPSPKRPQNLVSEPMGPPPGFMTKTPPARTRRSAANSHAKAVPNSSPHSPRDIIQGSPLQSQQFCNNTQLPYTEELRSADESFREPQRVPSAVPGPETNRLAASVRHHNQEHSARQSPAQTPTLHVSPVPPPGLMGSPAALSVASSGMRHHQRLSEKYQNHKGDSKVWRKRCEALEHEKQELNSQASRIDTFETQGSAWEEKVERLESDNGRLRKRLHDYREYLNVAVQEHQSLYRLTQHRCEEAVVDMRENGKNTKVTTEEACKKAEGVQTRLMNTVRSVSDQAKAEVLAKDIIIEQFREQLQGREADLERERERGQDSQRIEELADSIQRDFNIQVSSLMSKLEPQMAGFVRDVQQRNSEDISRLEAILLDVSSRRSLDVSEADSLSDLVQLAQKSLPVIDKKLNALSCARANGQKDNTELAKSIQVQLEGIRERLAKRDLLAIELTEEKRASAALITATEQRDAECRNLRKRIEGMNTQLAENKKDIAGLSEELARLRPLQQQSEEHKADIAALTDELDRLHPLQQLSEDQKKKISALSAKVDLLHGTEREAESLRADIEERSNAIAELERAVKARDEVASDTARRYKEKDELAQGRLGDLEDAISRERLNTQTAVRAAEDARKELAETRLALEKRLSEANESRRHTEEMSQKEAAAVATVKAEMSDLQSQTCTQLSEAQAALASRECEIATSRLQVEELQGKEVKNSEELQRAQDLAQKLGSEVSMLKGKHQRASHTIASLEAKILEVDRQMDAEVRSPRSTGNSSDLQVLTNWQQWASALTGSLKQWVLRSRKAKRIYRKLQDTPDFKLDLGGDEELEAAKDATSVFLAIYEYLKQQAGVEHDKANGPEISGLVEVLGAAEVRHVKLRSPLVEETPTSTPLPVSAEQARRRQMSQPKPILKQRDNTPSDLQPDSLPYSQPPATRKRTRSQTQAAESPIVLPFERVTRQKRALSPQQ